MELILDQSMLQSLRCLSVWNSYLLTIVGVQILCPEIDIISEMRSCLLFGIAKVVDLATKCNMICLHPQSRAYDFEIVF